MKELLIINFCKNYGRKRGSDASAGYFRDRINFIIHHYRKIYNNFLKNNLYFNHNQFKSFNCEVLDQSDLKLLIERFKVQKRILKKNNINFYACLFEESYHPFDSLTHKKILFSFNMIQNPMQYGNYNFYQKQNDIKFGKGVGNKEYIQALYPAAILNKEFFPKYFLPSPIDFFNIHKKFLNLIENYRKFQKNNDVKIPIKIGIYDREDICPNQSKQYDNFIKNLPILFENFEIEFFKFGNNKPLDKFNFNDFLKDMDIVLYTEPDHFDPYPNTILQAISNGCLIYNLGDINSLKNDANGIYELETLFPERFLNCYSSWEDVEKKLFFKNKNSSKEITRIKGIIKHRINSLLGLTDYYIFNKIIKELDSYIELNELK